MTGRVDRLDARSCRAPITSGRRKRLTKHGFGACAPRAPQHAMALLAPALGAGRPVPHPRPGRARSRGPGSLGEDQSGPLGSSRTATWGTRLDGCDGIRAPSTIYYDTGFRRLGGIGVEESAEVSRGSGFRAEKKFFALDSSDPFRAICDEVEANPKHPGLAALIRGRARGFFPAGPRGGASRAEPPEQLDAADSRSIR